MRLTVNGEEQSFAGLAHVADLVSALGLDPRKVAVERNLEIVPRSTYGVTALVEGDRIEIANLPPRLPHGDPAEPLPDSWSASRPPARGIPQPQTY